MQATVTQSGATKPPRYSQHRIVQRARQRLKDGNVKYHLIFSNCEHFATWCVTGCATSEQVQDSASKALAAGGAHYAARQAMQKPAEAVVKHALSRVVAGGFVGAKTGTFAGGGNRRDSNCCGAECSTDCATRSCGMCSGWRYHRLVMGGLIQHSVTAFNVRSRSWPRLHQLIRNRPNVLTHPHLAQLVLWNPLHTVIRPRHLADNCCCGTRGKSRMR